MAHALKLFHAHTACTRVTLTALEQCGCDYEDQLLVMEKGEHKRPDFLAVNPQGKVPALLVDGNLLTENGAIMLWLDETFPDAGLLPVAANEWERSQQVADLLWVSATWHPYVRANKVPFMWTTGDVEPVRERGRALLTGVVEQLEARLAEQPFWYGEDWSIVDIYLWWAYINAEIGGYSIEPFPNVRAHRSRNEAHPALKRALAREQAAIDARNNETNP